MNLINPVNWIINSHSLMSTLKSNKYQSNGLSTTRSSHRISSSLFNKLFTMVTLIVYILFSSSIIITVSAKIAHQLPSTSETIESNSVDCSPNDPNYTLCRNCPCNRSGIIDPENCDEPCECKSGVTGQFCDQCKHGYVNLDQDNPEGCTKCFCYNVTNSCRITYWPSMIITNPDNWLITTLRDDQIVEPQQNDDHLVIADDDAPSAPIYYWSAPSDYLGDMYRAYGRQAKISLSATVLRGDSAGNPVYGPDIVLEGSDLSGNRLLIGYNWKSVPFEKPERTKINRKIVMSERNWFHIDENGSNQGPVNREEFIMVLSSLNRLLIRAYYHTDQIEGSFYNVDVLVASNKGGSESNLDKMTQECDCPEGYEKPFCGPGCLPGYRRVNNTLIGGICEKCDCNNHSLTCDPYTGECISCLHNTKGPKCDQCIEGFTGNPTIPGGFCVPIEYVTTAIPTSSSSLRPEIIRTTSKPLTDPPWIPNEPITTYPFTYWPEFELTTLPSWSEPPSPPTPLTTYPPPVPCWPYEYPTTTELPTTTQPPPPPSTTPFIATFEKCQYSCAGLHIPVIWYMETNLSEINIDDIFHFPYALASLIRKEANIRESLRRTTNLNNEGLTLVDSLTNQLEDSLTMDSFNRRLNISETTAINMINSLSDIMSLSTNQLDEIVSLKKTIAETIDNIESFSRETIIESEPNIWAEMLQKSSAWLESMMNIDLTSKLVDVTVEREQSVVFMGKVEAFLSTFREQISLVTRLEQIKTTCNQFEDLINQQIPQKVYMADQQRKRISSIIESLIVNSTNNQKLVDDYSRSIREGFGHIEGSSVYLSMITRVTADLEAMKNDLNRSVAAIERVRSIYSRLNPFYEDIYVNPCRERVNQEIGRINEALDEHDKRINLLKPYINIPWTNNETIVSIERAEIHGETAINTLLNQVIDDVVNQGIGNRATESRGTSDQLLREIVIQSSTISDRSPQIAIIERFKEEVRLYESCFSSHEAISNELNNFTRSLEPRIKDSKDTIQFSYILDIGLKSIESRVAEINESLVIIDGPQVEVISQKWMAEKSLASSYVNKSTSLVGSIFGEIEKVTILASTASYQRQTIEANLSDLRKRITLARQKAAEIGVALASEPDTFCVRSYSIETQPSSANSISFYFAIDQENVKDVLILSIVNPDDGDFLAIDMIDRTIRFLWSLGTNGTTIIEHPTRIETSPKNLEETFWYRVEAQRVATVGTLSVQRMVDNHVNSVNPVKSVSSANYSILDVSSSNLLWVGGHSELNGHNLPDELTTNGFKGFIADLVYDDKHIGLWNFNYSSPIGCRAWTKGHLESSDYNVFHFNGKSSYSVLDQIPRYDNRNYQVVLLMKTFDESAVIFFCSDTETGNYIAIHLINGRISFSFRDGPETWLKLITSDKYNNGNWFRVTAARSESRAMLVVDEETIEGEVETYSSDLGGCKIHFGGIPPNFTTHWWPNIDFKPFLGCMKDVQIDTTPLNLLDGETFGLSTGCKNDLPRSSRFNGKGYLELKGLPLRDNNVISLTFKTKQKDAIILIVIFKNPKKTNREFQYYSLAINGGSLESRFNPGTEETLLISRVNVTDGQFHTVTITKRNRRVWITVDDFEVINGKLGPGRNIGNSAASESGLYLGGVPGSSEWSKILGTNQSLDGVIKDFISDGKVIYFNNFISYDYVEIGRGI